MTYVFIPPGHFYMGCSMGDLECLPDEKPSREVSISIGFWLGQTPITVGAFKRFASETGRQLPLEALVEGRQLNPGWADERMPMVMVDWADAAAYAAWLGGRLPMEAEWEYAARGGTAAARFGELEKVAWHRGNSGERLHPVAEKQPNQYGLYDMLGNVWEWTADWYTEDLSRSSHGTAERVPLQPLQCTEYRSIRGGSWCDIPQLCRASVRGRTWPDARFGSFGFRCIWG